MLSSGLPKRYRQVVEILFRSRHLKVIVATGTLAYGINMPCRTCVFAGDSFFLTPLQVSPVLATTLLSAPPFGTFFSLLIYHTLHCFLDWLEKFRRLTSHSPPPHTHTLAA